MLFIFFQRDVLFQPKHFAIDAHAHEAFLAQCSEDILEFTFFSANDWSHDLETGTGMIAVNAVDDLIDRITMDRLAALRAIGRPGPGKEKAQEVIDFRDRSDSRTRIVGRTLLLDRDGRRKAFDVVHVGFFLHA